METGRREGVGHKRSKQRQCKSKRLEQAGGPCWMQSAGLTGRDVPSCVVAEGFDKFEDLWLW